MSPEQGEAPSFQCPVAATMDLLMGKWTLHILRELMDGRNRFNELSRALGSASSRTLCCRLRALELQQIVVREVKNTIPPWVEYDLTEKGRALNAVIDSIATWGRVHMQEIEVECGSTARLTASVTESCVEAFAHCGEPLGETP
jgi:DNA-binding HxlR family transcriptional regulator